MPHSVFECDGLSRKMRKVVQECEKDVEADSSCTMEGSCLGVNGNEWIGQWPCCCP